LGFIQISVIGRHAPADLNLLEGGATNKNHPFKKVRFFAIIA